MLISSSGPQPAPEIRTCPHEQLVVGQRDEQPLPFVEPPFVGGGEAHRAPSRSPPERR